jgi:hypothetical protein
MPASSVSERVRTCLEKAAECDRRALLVSDAAAQETYRELAGLWRDMARQIKLLHDQVSSL